MRRHLTILNLLLLSVLGFAQSFLGDVPEQSDTLYHPFYNGVQMIEIDHNTCTSHISFIGNKIRSQPFNPYFRIPLGNEILMRDSLGIVVRSYNTSLNFDTIKLRPVPFVNCSGKKCLNRMDPYLFNGQHFKFIYNQSLGDYPNNSYNWERRSSLRKGLLDSFGREVLPIEYQEILPENGNFIVKKNGKWGLINADMELILPHHYDSYRSEKEHIFFLDSTLYKAAYHRLSDGIIVLKENFLYPIHYSWSSHFVVKKGDSLGIVNITTNEQIVPTEYSHISVVSYKKGMVLKVHQNKKFGVYSKQGKLMVPCKYDTIHHWRRENGFDFKVELNGETFMVTPIP